jgi:hypothetical protein
LATSSHLFACAMGAISRWSKAITGRKADVLEMVANDAVNWANAIEMDTSYGNVVRRKS